MAARRRGRREEPEEHDNHERWLVTYADMVTLLMVLFIVMFAMSVVDEKKFNALKAGLAAGFGQSTSVLEGSDSLLEQPGATAIEPVRAELFLADFPESQRATISRGVVELQSRCAACAGGSPLSCEARLSFTAREEVLQE